MSLYVLDTDTLQLYQDGNAAVVNRVNAVAPGDLAISVVTVEEQLSGWYAQLRQAKQPERLAWAYRRLAATVRFLTRILRGRHQRASVPPSFVGNQPPGSTCRS